MLCWNHHTTSLEVTCMSSMAMIRDGSPQFLTMYSGMRCMGKQRHRICHLKLQGYEYIFTSEAYMYVQLAYFTSLREEIVDFGWPLVRSDWRSDTWKGCKAHCQKGVWKFLYPAL